MPINNWWESDGSERYWMEITNRDDLGADLKAPQRDASGNETWSYTLVSYVQPGDVVFHWHTSFAGEPALVGWSEATGPLEEIDITWQARGSSGRSRGVPTTGAGWRVPLRNFTELEHLVTRGVVNQRRQPILDIIANLKKQADGPLYAPFQDYGGRELRAQQGYLSKFPAALVPVLLGVERPGSPITKSADERRFVQPSARQGYFSDAAVRTAVEKRAVHLARNHYLEAGATEIEELGKPYDLRVVLNKVERHVEVKGATGIGIDSVQLTQGEVDHAHTHQPTDLFVVEQINVARDDAGEVTASGGLVRLWEDWAPANSSLRPTHLRYKLPHV